MAAESKDRIEATLAAIRADLERSGTRPEGPMSPEFEARPERPLDEHVRRRVDELIRAWLRENLHQTVRELLQAEIDRRDRADPDDPD